MTRCGSGKVEGYLVRKERENKWQERKMMNGNSIGIDINGRNMDTQF